MKVVYTIDKQKDKKKIYTMLKSQDPKGNLNRAKSMGIDLDTFKLIQQNKSYKEVKSKIDGIYESRYSKDKDLLFQKRNEFQRKWDEINDKFFVETQKITDLEWKFSEYNVITSLFHPGISNMFGNEVYLWIYDTSQVHLRIVAHELLMTHIWNYFFSNFPIEDVSNNWNKYWSVNEIVCSFILGIEPTLNSLWSDDMKGYDDSYLQDYPQLFILKKVFIIPIL